MKILTNVLCIAVLFISAFGYGQILYSDSFDEGILKAESVSGNYTISLNNDRLQVVGSGTAGKFDAIGYELHDSGTNQTLDITSKSKLYIKAKASITASLRIDLIDESDYASNSPPVAVTVTSDFRIFELDFDKDLSDGGFGGTGCESSNAPCPLDKTKIKGLIFFINASSGGYNGTLEVEWISFGEPLEAIPPPPTAPTAIVYNQVSYFSGQDKFIAITSGSDIDPQNFTIENEEGTVVLSGTSSNRGLWNEANLYVSMVNATSLTEEGTYTLKTPIKNITFTIDDRGYNQMRRDVFRYYYFNRASTEITPALGGEYARAAGHPDTNVKIHASAASASRPEGFEISAPKGWYDAGDYNKYVVNSGISTYTLLAAYEHYIPYYNELEFNIPERGGELPDILDEVIWNLDWMIAMQDPNDGGVYHKLTRLSFSGRVMPSKDTEPRYVVQKTTAAALNLAAVAAQASRVFANFESAKPGYSQTLLETAKAAYNWAKANPKVFYVQPADVCTGQYGDDNVSDEFNWAAVELFITTGETVYKNDIDVSAIGAGTPFWGYVDPLALISITHHQDALKDAINVQTAIDKLTTSANVFKTTYTNSPMNITMGKDDYSWGSNSQLANQVLLLIRAYELTDDPSYLDVAYSTMDYLMGRNGTGYSFISGYGNLPMRKPHHRISDADKVLAPIPGMLAGGPQNNLNPDAGACSGPSNGTFPAAFPAVSYVDDWCSYSTNEVTINWNAPLSYVVNALHFYKNGTETLSVPETTLGKKPFAVALSPNPVDKLLTITTSFNFKNLNLTLHNIQGKKLIAQKLTAEHRTIDLSTIEAGIYLITIKGDNFSFTDKIVKAP